MEMFAGTLDALDKIRITKPLKFEDLANRGDRIRGYDFMGNTEAYIEGVVVDKGYTPGGYKGYTIQIDKDGMGAGREGDKGYIPFETAFMEYDTRIELVEAA
jgi:hypothetical protein